MVIGQNEEMSWVQNLPVYYDQETVHLSSRDSKGL